MSTLVTQRGRQQLRYMGLRIPDLPATMLGALETALTAGIQHWYSLYAPEHFRMGAYQRYGGREPNVYTIRYRGRGVGKTQREPLRSIRPHRGFDGERAVPGTLQRAFLSGGMKVQAKGRTTRDLLITATWPGLPRYTYIDKHGPNRSQGPKKYLELTIVNEAEASDIATVVAKALEAELSRAGGGQTAAAA